MRKLMLGLIFVFAVFTMVAHTGCSTVNNTIIVRETNEGFYTEGSELIPWNLLPHDIQEER